MGWLNLIVWVLMLVITITWTVGVITKPSSFGPTNFKLTVLLWISILFVFFIKISPLNFIYMIPASFIIAGYASFRGDTDYIIENKLQPESIFKRIAPNTEGLFRALIHYSIFLVAVFIIIKIFLS